MPELLNTLDGLAVVTLVLIASGLTVRHLWRAARPSMANSREYQAELAAGQQAACSSCRVPRAHLRKEVS